MKTKFKMCPHCGKKLSRDTGRPKIVNANLIAKIRTMKRDGKSVKYISTKTKVSASHVYALVRGI